MLLNINDINLIQDRAISLIKTLLWNYSTSSCYLIHKININQKQIMYLWTAINAKRNLAFD